MLILVSGLPGSGKSYFATRLANKLKAEYVNSDQLRKSMDAQGDYSFKDKLAVYEEMARISGKRLEEGKAVVVDATFYKQSLRELFLQTANHHHCIACFIFIEANESLVKERISQSRDYSEADFEVYKMIKNEFEKITVPHLKIKSTNANIHSMLETAIRYIKEIHDGK